jgi:hypothetical protein
VISAPAIGRSCGVHPAFARIWTIEALRKLRMRLVRQGVGEAGTGIEPVCAALQAAA